MHATSFSMHQPDLKRRILDGLVTDQHYLQVKENLQQGDVEQKIKQYEIKEDGLLMYKNRIYVPSSGELRNLVLKEMHDIPYARNLGYQTKITTVRSQFFYSGMKKDVSYYIARCMEFQKVKAEHRNPTGLLLPLPIPEKKWEVITMDFMTGLPRENKKHDSIIVVVDKLTKFVHFLPMKTTHTTTNIVEIFMKEIARLHGILRTPVLDRDKKFTSNFWRGLFKGFGTNINFSRTYHP
jgi:hypothetical protein